MRYDRQTRRSRQMQTMRNSGILGAALILTCTIVGFFALSSYWPASFSRNSVFRSLLTYSGLREFLPVQAESGRTGLEGLFDLNSFPGHFDFGDSSPNSWRVNSVLENPGRLEATAALLSRTSSPLRLEEIQQLPGIFQAELKRPELPELSLNFRSIPLLPGDNFEWNGAKKASPGVFYVLVAGVTPDRQDTPAVLKLISDNGTEIKFEVSPFGKVSALKIPVELQNSRLSFVWEDTAPGLLLFIGMERHRASKSLPGVVFITVDTLEDLSKSLPKTKAFLDEKYGKDHWGEFGTVWPSSPEPSKNLAALFSQSSPVNTGLALFPAQMQASVKTLKPAIETAFSGAGYSSLRMNIGEVTGCEKETCKEAPSLDYILGVSAFDRYYEFARERELTLASQPLFSVSHVFENQFLNVNIIMPFEKLALTWKSAFDSDVNIFTWISKGLQQRLFKNTQLRDVKLAEKSRQVDDFVARLIGSFPQNPPHLMLMVQKQLNAARPEAYWASQNDLTDNRQTWQYSQKIPQPENSVPMDGLPQPTQPGALLIASPAFRNVAKPDRNGVFLQSDIVESLKSVFVENSPNPRTRLFEGSIANGFELARDGHALGSVHSSDGELFLFPDGWRFEPNPFRNLKIQKHFVSLLEESHTLPALRNNLAIKKIFDLRSQYTLHTLNFKYLPTNRDRKLTFDLSSPVPIYGCTANQKTNFADTLIETDKSVFNTRAEIRIPSDKAWQITCILDGKFEQKTPLIAKFYDNDILVKSERVRVGEFSIPASTTAEEGGVALWPDELASSAYAAYLPPYEQLTNMSVLLWKNSFPAIPDPSNDLHLFKVKRDSSVSDPVQAAGKGNREIRLQ